MNDVMDKMKENLTRDADQQLNDLIKLTQTDLSKADRTRVMVMITMDSHSRDVIQT